jgi:FkbM family methyltransferase
MPTHTDQGLRARLAKRMGRFLGVSDVVASTDSLTHNVQALEADVRACQASFAALTGTAVAVAAPAAAAEPAAPVAPGMPQATAGEIYAGYSTDDMWVFDDFVDVHPTGAPGFVTDFIGTRTRTSSLWNEVRFLDGTVMGKPVPHDIFEAIEWVGLLKAVLAAGDGRFAMMELGAGLGPWLAAGSVAARLRGLGDLRLLGVEADPGRFELMRQNFADNGLDPDAQRLVCAAVGVEKGHARWPRIADPANAAGARPVRETEGGLDQDDVNYIPHAAEDYIDVDIMPFEDLLAEQPAWDLVHVDVQGWEAKLIAACLPSLNERVRYMVVGTHSRLIDGQVIELLHQAGWVMENEKPTRFRFDPAQPSLDQMTEIDGVQVWRNPAR